MRKLFILLSICLLFLLAACGGSGSIDEEPTSEADSQTNEGDNALTVIEATAVIDELPRATITPPPVPVESDSAEVGYPPPPEATTLPEGYTAQESVQIDPYPGPDYELLPQPDVEFASITAGTETIWISISAGIQCDEEADSYEDIIAVVDYLGEQDVAVYDGQTEARLVCSACGCPESVYYRVMIDVEDLETAVSLGFDEDITQ